MRLADVVLVKMVFTIVLWGVPLLFGPPALFKRLGVPFPEPALFLRLLGAAYLAMFVGYYHGWQDSLQGLPIPATVQMGAVSNGLAALILAYHAITGTWSHWKPLGRAYMWVSLAATASITVGLLIAR